MRARRSLLRTFVRSRRGEQGVESSKPCTSNHAIASTSEPSNFHIADSMLARVRFGAYGLIVKVFEIRVPHVVDSRPDLVFSWPLSIMTSARHRAGYNLFFHAGIFSDSRLFAVFATELSAEFSVSDGDDNSLGNKSCPISWAMSPRIMPIEAYECF